jgi:hypothetical protein
MIHKDTNGKITITNLNSAATSHPRAPQKPSNSLFASSSPNKALNPDVTLCSNPQLSATGPLPQTAQTTQTIQQRLIKLTAEIDNLSLQKNHLTKNISQIQFDRQLTVTTLRTDLDLSHSTQILLNSKISHLKKQLSVSQKTLNSKKQQNLTLHDEFNSIYSNPQKIDPNPQLLAKINKFALNEAALSKSQSKFTVNSQQLAQKTAFMRKIDLISTEKSSSINVLQKLLKQAQRAEELAGNHVQRGWHKLEGLREIYSLLENEVKKLAQNCSDFEEKKNL